MSIHPDRNRWQSISTPDSKIYTIPNWLDLRFPSSSSLPLDQQHYLAYITWTNEYLKAVPLEFLPFFQQVLPFLKVRTTDVHTAICMGFLDTFINSFTQKIDRLVVGTSLVLHDSG